jgi:hypothetical protein
MTREICKACGRVNPVGFTVPDDVWNAATDRFDGVLCILCFAQRADDSGLSWDNAIEFYPVSLATHRSSDDFQSSGRTN